MAKTVFARTAGGNWSTDATWSLSSGGPANTTHPVATDTVIMDANSGQVTVDVTSACAIVNCTGYTNTLTLNADLTTTGAVTFVAGMTFTPNTSTWHMGCSTVTYTPAGKTFYGLDFNVGGTLTISGGNCLVSHLLSCATATTVTLATNNITCSGGVTLTGSAVILGQTITMNGTGTLQHTSHSGAGGIRSALTFNTAGTITLGTDIYYQGTVTYTAGTITNTSSTIHINGNTTMATSGMHWNTLSAETSGGTISLTSDLNLDGDFTNTASITVNGAFNINLKGNLTLGTTAVAGSSTFVMNGTGTWSAGSSAGVLSNPLTFNTAGTITVSGNVYYGAAGGHTITYTAGTVTLSGSTLNITGSCVFTDATNTWVNFNCTTNATLTLSQATSISGNLTVANGATLTLASHNISVGGNLTLNTSATVTGQTITLNGTGTWSHPSHTAGSVASAVIVNTAGTITVSGDIYVSATSFTYTSGTMILNSSTLHFLNSYTFTDATNTWVNFTFDGNASLTLSQVTTISGNLTVLTAVQGTLVSNDITVQGSLTTAGTGSITGATRKIILSGTGTWSGGGGMIETNLDINTAGTITLSGTPVFGGTSSSTTLNYIAGTLVGDGTENLCIIAVRSGTKTVHLPTTLTLFQFTLVNSSGENTTGGGNGNIILDASKTITVSNYFKAHSDIGSLNLKTGTPGTQTKIVATSTGKFPSVSDVAAADIDSSGGWQILDQNGTLSNTVNWGTSYPSYPKPSTATGVM